MESFCTGTFCFVFIALGRIYKVMTVIEALNKLKLAGLPDKQAEAILEAFEERDRSWFESHFERLRTEMEKMRRELQTEIEKVRRELQAEIEKVRGEIKDAKFQMIFWIVGSFSIATLINHFWR
jgi:biopolymer transport protein ExbB/TolQ